jgi:hypothetical protein
MTDETVTQDATSIEAETPNSTVESNVADPVEAPRPTGDVQQPVTSFDVSTTNPHPQ